MPPKKQITNKPEEETSESNEGDLLMELTAGPSLESAAILSAIDGMSNKMVERFKSLEASLQASKTTLAEHASRLSAVGVMASDHDGRLAALKLQAQHLGDANTALQDKVVDLEARSRRQNIKIIGLPVNTECSRPVEFVASLIENLLGKEHFPKHIEVDHAHSLGGQAANGANRPRILIARIHNYRVKELIMRLAAQQSLLMYQGQRIRIFPDFPVDIMKQRQLFEDIMKRLKSAGLCTRFIYPARLRVTHGNVTSTFNDPEEAEIFAKQFCQVRMSQERL